MTHITERGEQADDSKPSIDITLWRWLIGALLTFCIALVGVVFQNLSRQIVDHDVQLQQLRHENADEDTKIATVIANLSLVMAAQIDQNRKIDELLRLAYTQQQKVRP